MQITRGKLEGAQKLVLYAPEGFGKTTFASKFEDVVFIDTEGSTKQLDVARLGLPHLPRHAQRHPHRALFRRGPP